MYNGGRQETEPPQQIACAEEIALLTTTSEHFPHSEACSKRDYTCFIYSI
jgi:hypothetical protein